MAGSSIENEENYLPLLDGKVTYDKQYLKVYQNGDKLETNGERGLKRKLSALRSFYAYYFKREMIHTNPSVLIDVPKIHQKSIIRLDTDEVALLLDYIEHCGDQLTGQKRVYYEKTKETNDK